MNTSSTTLPPKRSPALGPHGINRPLVRVEEIPTPFLRIRPRVVADNIARMAQYAKSKGLSLRPHAKTHKSLRVAAMQLDAGAIGLTVAKPSEAEVMAQVCHDLLIAYPIVQPAAAQRVANLAAQGNRMTVAVDSLAAAQNLAQAAMSAGVTIDLLVDVNLGFGRTGIGELESVLTLAQFIHATPGIEFAGIFCYPGNVMGPPDTQHDALSLQSERLIEVKSALLSVGLSPRIVSGGSTPTGVQSHFNPQLTEIRPGTYVYNDRMCVTGGHATFDQCAAIVIATVVSDAVPGQVVVDAGSKMLTSDGALHVDGHGHVLEFPEAVIRRLSEEHGMIDVSACPKPPVIGQRISIVPNHICPCINLTDATYWANDEDNVAEIDWVDARGCVW
jgi:D-serine deaminase-like pyridoxal phosphate-dependent protein